MSKAFVMGGEESKMACYLCGGGEFLLRKGSVRDDPDAQIHQCDACGLVFLSGLKPKDLTEFYQTGGMHAGAESEIPVETWLKETARDDERRFESFREQITNNRVLDFGCGAGGFLLRAATVAGSVTGLELEQRFVPHFKKNALEVHADIADIPPGAQFDVITAFHVLEHLPDPRDMLMQFKKFLAPSGNITIEVPSADDALLTLYNSEPFSRFTYWSCHLYLFNAHTLSVLAKQAGLRVKYISHVQRYPLSNHLYWLAKGMPGGHNHWGFLDSPGLTAAYENTLALIGKTDTVIACLTR